MMSESSAPPDLPGSPLYVVDSWPVLEWIYGKEPAGEKFQKILDSAANGNLRLHISRLNYGEVIYNVLIRKRRGEFSGLIPDLDALPWQIVSIDDALVDEAVALKAVYPISFADCFVAALAQRHRAPVISGDPDFQRLAERGVLRLEWVGK